MIRTIAIGPEARHLIQGNYDRTLRDGRVQVRIGGKFYVGRAV